jgi:hypothetical protein
MATGRRFRIGRRCSRRTSIATTPGSSGIFSSSEGDGGVRQDRPLVASGIVIAYRLFDIAYAIDLAKAEALWARRMRSVSTRAQLNATPAKAMAFGVPPVEIGLEPVALQMGTASVTARLYDFGVLTIAVLQRVSDLRWPDFVERVNATERWLGTGAESNLWGSLLSQVRTTFHDALVRPAKSAVEEDYLIAAVEAFDEPMSAEQLQARIDLIPLLSGERRALSPSARQEVLRQRFSYYTDDLVVLTWDRAFIYEPRGDSDVVDVLEVANAQLLEMRYYDELLDAELPRMYDLIERAQGAAGLFASWRFANLARRLTTLVAEVTELTEKVDNALQVTEDVYLARVYAAALELFRVRAVGAAVDRKLAIIRDSYTALYHEASAARAALMEAVIVLLIAIEIVLAVFRH